MSNLQESKRDGYRWVMLAAYCLLAVGIWMSWFAQAPLLHGYWGKVYHINESTGNLLLSLPGLVAVFLGISMGRWIDVYGVRLVLGLGAILATIGFGLRPFFITSFEAQLVLTVIGGFGILALTATLAPTMIQWFGHEAAHIYIGIGAGFYFIGAGLGVLLTATLVGSHGVQGTFTIWSAIILAMTIVWWILGRNKPGFVSQEKGSLREELRNVMQTRSAWLGLVESVFIGGAPVFVMGFVPMQMVVVHKLPPALAGVIVGLFAISAGVGFAILPPLAGRWGRKATGVVIGLIALVVWIVYMLIPSLQVAGLVVFALVLGFFYEAPWALGLAIQENLPGVTPRNVGVMAGLWTMATNLGVFVLPLIQGAMVDHFSIEGGMWSILVVYVLFLLAMILTQEKPEAALVKETQSAV